MKSIHVTVYTFLLILIASCQSGLPKYDATGTFETTEVLVSAEANGKILTYDVEEGDYLKQGACVGLIDTLQLYLKKVQLEANMRSVEEQRPDIKKQVAALKEQIATAERDKQRYENLFNAGAGNEKQLQDAESQLVVLRNQLTATYSSLSNSDESLSWQGSSVGLQIAQVDDQLSKCYISSPINGTVLTNYAEAGELASVGKPLFKVADMDKIYLRAYITSDQLANVAIGTKATVYADYGNKEKAYPGEVIWVSQQSEFTPKTILTKDERANLVYAIKIKVKNDGDLKIGMYGGVKWD